jgi:hypothetical protein
VCVGGSEVERGIRSKVAVIDSRARVKQEGRSAESAQLSGSMQRRHTANWVAKVDIGAVLEEQNDNRAPTILGCIIEACVSVRH